MISPKVIGAAATLALVLAVAAPTAGLAEYRANNGGVRANGGYRPPPPGSVARPGPAVAAAPAVGGYRAAAPMAQLAEAAGFIVVAMAVVITAAIVITIMTAIAAALPQALSSVPSSAGRWPRKATAITAGRAFIMRRATPATHITTALRSRRRVAGMMRSAYCMQTYPSYDPQSGTYLGDDGYQHPCP